MMLPPLSGGEEGWFREGEEQLGPWTFRSVDTVLEGKTDPSLLLPALIQVHPRPSLNTKC